jgi:hypothetical protein
VALDAVVQRVAHAWLGDDRRGVGIRAPAQRPT